MNDRPSFAKNKIAQSYVGSTGITGTSKLSVEPSSSVDYTEQDGFSASKTLFDNIDLLGKKLGVNKDEAVLENEEDEYEGMSEEEAAKIYMSKEFKPSMYSNQVKNSLNSNSNFEEFNDNFCTQCGSIYRTDHKFCGKCGTKRQ
jgi:hypothetical protein